MEEFWKTIPPELQIRILYYSVKSPLNQTILKNIRNYSHKLKSTKSRNFSESTYNTFIRNRIRNALLTIN